MSVDARSSSGAGAPRPRRRWLLAGALVLALVTAGLAGGAWWYDSVPTPELAALPGSSTLYYRDATTVLGRIGSVDRTVLGYEELVPVVPQVAVAAADPDFWTGTAGPISRSVARLATEAAGGGPSTGVRLAVQARKVDEAYAKERILAYYLNAAPFGRGALGIEAAARAYFGTTARRSALAARQLTLAQAMYLLAASEAGTRPDDPRVRWAGIRDAMVGAGSLTAAAAAALTYPEVRPEPSAAEPGRPVGLIANQVLSELSLVDWPGRARAWDQVGDGGYDIVTTLDAGAQEATEGRLAPDLGDVAAAAVVVEPGTGRVLAYYGGADPTGPDRAGTYRDAAGQPAGAGYHPPGSSFQVQTLAAALRAGVSLRSRWDAASPMPGRSPDHPVRNRAACPTGGSVCTLLDSARVGLDTTFYLASASVGPAAVLATAKDAGLESIWTDDRTYIDLRATDPTVVAPARFDVILGLGQYPVTVLDQANTMATYAGDGLRADAHFVREVRRSGEVIYAEPGPDPDRVPVLTPGQLGDLTWALNLGDIAGSVAAGHPGTWEYPQDPPEVAHAWMVGFTPNLGIAVWVGPSAAEHPLGDREGLPMTIFRSLVEDLTGRLDLPQRTFPAPTFGGREDPPFSVAG